MNTHHLIITLNGGPFMNPAFPSEAEARQYALSLMNIGISMGSPVEWTYNPNVGLGTWYGAVEPDDGTLRVIFLGEVP